MIGRNGHDNGNEGPRRAIDGRRAPRGTAHPQGRADRRRSRPVHRVVAARAALASQAAVPVARRARRLVAVAPVPGLFRATRLGGPRAEPARPLLVRDGRLRRARLRHVPRGRPGRREHDVATADRGRPRHGRAAGDEARRAAARFRARPVEPGAAGRAAGAAAVAHGPAAAKAVPPRADRLGRRARAAATARTRI